MSDEPMTSDKMLFRQNEFRCAICGNEKKFIRLSENNFEMRCNSDSCKKLWEKYDQKNRKIHD